MSDDVADDDEADEPESGVLWLLWCDDSATILAYSTIRRDLPDDPRLAGCRILSVKI